MSSKRKIIEAYFNVDGGYWSDASGNFAVTPAIPRFGLYEQIAFKLHLIHNFGVQVTDYTNEQAFRLTIYSNTTGAKLLETVNAQINTVEGQEFWAEADSSKGLFVLLMDCTATALQTALANVSSLFTPFEFTVTDSVGMIANYQTYVYCTNSRFAGASQIEDTLASAMKQGTLEIVENSSFSLIEEDTTKYNMLAPSLIAPEDTELNYGVTSVTITEQGFKVYYNATIAEAGFTLSYTLIRKV